MSRHIQHPTIEGPEGPLESQLLVPPRPRPGAGLVCHPHPLHGGTMHTKAVYRAARALEATGLPVLRFNFRGVGRSAGRSTGGPAEREDVRATLAWLELLAPNQPLVVGGFSFGSWVGLEVARAVPQVVALIGIAPPLALYDFTFLHGEQRPVLLIAGDHDPFCPVPLLDSFAARLGPRTRRVVLHGAEHLLVTHLDPLEAAIREFAAGVLDGL
jgi:uncharacterized protein